MGNALHRAKGWIYGFVMVVVLILVSIRAYNAWQKTTYHTRPIEGVGEGIQISLNYPVKIPGSKIEALYPLTIGFTNQGDRSQAHTYEFIFESPTLLFTDSEGGEVASQVQITSDYAFIEESIYIRPFLAEQYPGFNRISVKVLLDGEKIETQPDFIEIKNEPLWFSYASLFAASILEVSVVLALLGLIINFIGNAQESQKELMERRNADLQELAARPILEQARRYIDLEQKRIREHWDKELTDELHKKQPVFKEVEFLQDVGRTLREGQVSELTDLVKQYNRFFGVQRKNHQESITALARMIATVETRSPTLPLFLQTWRSIFKKERFAAKVSETPLSLITNLIKLWDDFDTDVKDLMIAALDRFSEKDTLSQLPKAELQSPDGEREQKQIFDPYNRRRLLRSKEISGLFPQLVPPPPSYDTVWRQPQECQTDPKMLDWLQQHDFAANPFGCDLRLYPAYPRSMTRPDQWESFVIFSPQIAICPTLEDVNPLAVLLREECLFALQIFPILISLQQENTTQPPLITLGHAAARSWLDVLSHSPNALLDLSLISQYTLLELLCWSLGSKETLINLLQQNGLEENVAGSVLKRRIAEFENCISSTHPLQNQVLLTWLGIRPPDLKQTGLILCLDGKPPPLAYSWCEHFSPFIPTLFQNKIITKVMASTPIVLSLSLPEIQLSWSDERLGKSLDSQFSAAMDKEVRDVMGKAIRFHELFGPGATEGETTHKLIAASGHSLARMLTLGNHLFQKHCEQEVPEKYLTPEELDDILTTT